MRQLNNKHFDTKEGASALPGKLSHPQFAPSVSQKDEIMNQEQKDLLVFLVRQERVRLNSLRRKSYYTYEDRKAVRKEILLCNLTLKSLEGGK
tara:strand:- start:300 stop:578 length:279 start_codon:yes stop_codon:yes gene_type:complete